MARKPKTERILELLRENEVLKKQLGIERAKVEEYVTPNQSVKADLKSIRELIRPEPVCEHFDQLMEVNRILIERIRELERGES